MPDDNLIHVKVVLRDGKVCEFDDVQYISLINDETYGIPALISDDRIKDELPVRILYVNPQNVAAVEAEREA